jgi:Tfp pilus assembly protein PilZ
MPKPEDDVTQRLRQLISDMSGDEKSRLLEQLEKKSYTEKREYPRKPYFMPLEYAAENKAYKDFSQNISIGGLYIETKEDIEVNQQITMIIPLFSFEDPIKITGKIIWRDANGIGVQFESDDPFIRQLIKSKIKEV